MRRSKVLQGHSEQAHVKDVPEKEHSERAKRLIRVKDAKSESRVKVKGHSLPTL